MDKTKTPPHTHKGDIYRNYKKQYFKVVAIYFNGLPLRSLRACYGNVSYGNITIGITPQSNVGSKGL